MKRTAIVCLVLIALFLASGILESVASAGDQASTDSWPMFHDDVAHVGIFKFASAGNEPDFVDI